MERKIPSSDIDLRVDKGNLKGLFALGALYADLEDGLGKKLDCPRNS